MFFFFFGGGGGGVCFFCCFFFTPEISLFKHRTATSTTAACRDVNTNWSGTQYQILPDAVLSDVCVVLMGSAVVKPVICILGNKVAQSRSVKSSSCITRPVRPKCPSPAWRKDPRRQILTAFSDTCYLSTYFLRVQLWEVYPLLIRLLLCLFKVFVMATICPGVCIHFYYFLRQTKMSLRWWNQMHKAQSQRGE